MLKMKMQEIHNLSRDELRRLYQEGGLVSFELTTVEGSSIDDLDLAKINAYYKLLTGKMLNELEIETNKLLENKKLIMREQGTCKATVVEILVFGKEPQKFLPYTAIKLARFKGKDMSNEIIDRKEATGTLAELIDELKEIPLEVISEDESSAELLDIYEKENFIRKEARLDLRHLAVATIYGVDAVVSWNFRDLVNIKTRRAVHAINLRLGFPLIEIVSPEEVIEYEE